jgi:hypothetical protein
MVYFFTIPLLLALILVLYGVYWLVKRSAKKLKLLPDPKIINPPNADFQFIEHKKLKEKIQEKGNEDQINLEGRILSNAKIQSIYLIHGTFVGNDPFQIISLIENNFPSLNSNIISSIQKGTREMGSLIASDLGNFISDHNQILKQITLGNIDIHNFTWSSGNNHIARVRGCFELIKDIYDQHNYRGERVLLIGHSHAGQLFALMTQLVNNPKLKNKLMTLVERHDYLPENLNIMIEHIASLDLDFVTLGTPARYEWKLNSKMRLLHFINHRSSDTLGGNFKGVLNTKDGDYIQQWGVSGSDMKSPIEKEHLVNIELDELFGTGSNMETLKQNIQLRRRLHNHGHHLLVDYGDNSKLPNFGLTCFGHGQYTKLDNFNFQLYWINKFFYTN